MKAKWALESLSEKKIKVTTLDEVNDPFEWLPGVLNPKAWDTAGLNRWLDGFSSDFKSSWGMICLCADKTNPVMWAHYADKHKGIALEFDYILDPELKELVKIDYSYDRVCLDPKVVNPIWRDGQKSTEFMQKAMSTKYESWQYEKEYRVIVPLKSCMIQSGNYFIKLPDNFLTRVILGVNCEYTDDDVVEAAGQDLSESIEIVQAKRSLNTFMIEC